MFILACKKGDDGMYTAFVTYKGATKFLVATSQEELEKLVREFVESEKVND